MEAQSMQIRDALNSFFKDDSGDMVEYMESMLYDWYQHYAINHYHIDHINKVVNAAFRVNDLLLKLHDAMQAAESGKEIKANREDQDLCSYSKAG
jgi:hypothetical protein